MKTQHLLSPGQPLRASRGATLPKTRSILKSGSADTLTPLTPLLALKVVHASENSTGHAARQA